MEFNPKAPGVFQKTQENPSSDGSQRCEGLQLCSRQHCRSHDLPGSHCGLCDHKPTRTAAPGQCAMDLTCVLSYVLCTELDNTVTEPASFRQSVPCSVSQ